MAIQPIAYLRDLFEDNLIAALWVNAFVPTGSATRAETGGQARFTLPSSTAGSHQAGYQSSGFYDLTGDQISINVDTMVSTSVAATAALTLFNSADPTSWVRIAQLSGNLNFQKSIAGVTTTTGTAVTWNASTHKYWRIRESAGTIFFDTSSNSTSWTNRGSVTIALSFAVTSLQIRIDATCGNVASPGSFRVEELNAIYPALSTNWHWTQVEWPLQNRFLQITIAATSGQGYIATADSTDASGNLVSPRYYSGPLGSASGGYNSLTLQASQALAQAQAVNMPLAGRWDLPSLDECRLIRLYHRSTDGSSYTIREYYPRRLIQSDDIEAESIRAINIAAGAVTADKIFVINLAAIHANMGTLHMDGVIDIAAAGGIYQGTGTFAVPTTGLKLFNSGGVGKLSTYNATVEQVTFDTDGRLKWGGGVGEMDADGIAISVLTQTSLPAVRAYGLDWFSGATNVGYVRAYNHSSAGGQVYINSASGPTGGSVFINGVNFNTSIGVVINNGDLNVGAGGVVVNQGVSVGTSGAGTGEIRTTGNAAIGDSINSVTRLRVRGVDSTSSNYALVVLNSAATASLIVRNDNRMAFFGASEIARPTVTGSRATDAWRTSLMSALSGLGLVTDSSSA